MKPWLRSQVWTAPICAWVGANSSRNWAGVTNLPYELLRGSETARASASAPAWLRQPRYTRKPTAAVGLTEPLTFAALAHAGVLPASLTRPVEAAETMPELRAVRARTPVTRPTDARMRKFTEGASQSCAGPGQWAVGLRAAPGQSPMPLGLSRCTSGRYRG